MKVILSLGSNVGDRRRAILKATSLLREKIDLEKVSSLYETEPWGYKAQGKFLNVSLSGNTKLNPYELLKFIKGVEKRVGRRERFRWGPREIDIDIIFFGDKVIKEGDLTIPHKYYKERNFVIIPLLEIEKDFFDPEEGKKVKEMFDVKDIEDVKKVEDFSFKRDVFTEFNLSLIDIPYNILLFKSIPSTQKFLKENFGLYLLTVSYIQTEGRGRKGNLWISKKGGLWFSFTERPIKFLYALPLISSLSVARVIKGLGIGEVNIKIPNDVYIKDKKVCGIISEGIFKDSLLGEVVGVGLNVNLEEKDLEGDFIKPPTSILIETKKFYFLDILLNSIITEYKEILNEFLNNRKRIVDELVGDFSLFDKPFKILKEGKLVEVYGLNIDEDLNITVKHKDGMVEVVPIHSIP